MATPSNFPTHGGLERVIERADATRSVFSHIFSARNLPTYVLGLTIMAVVTLTERALDAVETGFALEWAVLTFVSLVTFGLLARVIMRSTREAQSWYAAHAERARKTRADMKLWETARRDPRVMNEILAAQGRAEEFHDEVPPSVRVTMTVRDDGLAALAPWKQMTRYY